jgi:hypothetical protein
LKANGSILRRITTKAGMALALLLVQAAPSSTLEVCVLDLETYDPSEVSVGDLPTRYSRAHVKPSQYKDVNFAMRLDPENEHPSQADYITSTIHQSNQVADSLDTGHTIRSQWEATVRWRKEISHVFKQRYSNRWEDPDSVGTVRSDVQRISMEKTHDRANPHLYDDPDVFELSPVGYRETTYETLDKRRLPLCEISVSYEDARISVPEKAVAVQIVDDALARLERIRVKKATLSLAEQRAEFRHALRGLYASMKFERGTAGICDTFLRGVYAHQFGRVMPFVDGLDLKSMVIPEDIFDDKIGARLGLPR